jgi:glutamate racemase
MGPDVRLIDSAEETAAEAARTLAEKSLSAPDASAAVYRFVASDDPDQFLRVGQRFLGGAVENVEVCTLG